MAAVHPDQQLDQQEERSDRQLEGDGEDREAKDDPLGAEIAALEAKLKRLRAAAAEQPAGSLRPARQWRPWQPARMAGRKVIGKWLICLPTSAVYRLLQLAEPEDWGSKPALALDNVRNYLTHYFMRVFEQGDVLYFDRTEGRYAGQELLVWNTGLLTPQTTEIFAVMAPFRQDSTRPVSDREPAAAAGGVPAEGTQQVASEQVGATTADSLSKGEPPADIPVYPPTRDWEYCVVTFLSTNMLTKSSFQGKLGAPPLGPHQVPKRAFFFDETPECAVYNPNIPLMTNAALDWDHLKQRTSFRDNSSRLPQKLRDLQLTDDELAQRFRAGLERAKLRLLAHPRLAVPQYFRDKNERHGELQLLVPVSLGGIPENHSPATNGSSNTSSGNRPAGVVHEDIDVVLTLRLHRNAVMKDGVETDMPLAAASAISAAAVGNAERRFYTIGTLLPPQMAYFNARLVQPVDQEWLRSLAGVGAHGSSRRWQQQQLQQQYSPAQQQHQFMQQRLPHQEREHDSPASAFTPSGWPDLSGGRNYAAPESYGQGEVVSPPRSAERGAWDTASFGGPGSSVNWDEFQ